jgi:hypothetical protein
MSGILELFKKKQSALRVACGIVFIVLWLTGSFGLGFACVTCGIMANDSGRASNGSHMLLILCILLGNIVISLAGIPACIVFFLSGKRKALLLAFLLMILCGVGIIVVSVGAFFHFAIDIH